MLMAKKLNFQAEYLIRRGRDGRHRHAVRRGVLHAVRPSNPDRSAVRAGCPDADDPVNPGGGDPANRGAGAR